MARKSYFQLLAQADATLPDNVTGLITPADVRDMIKDFLDSFAPAYGALQTVTPFNVSVGQTDGPPLTYNLIYINNLPEWQSSAALGTLQRVGDPNTNNLTFQATIEAPSGRQITATLYRDGAPTSFSGSVTGAGNNNPVGMNIVALNTNATSTTFDVRLRADGSSAATVQINGAFFIGQTVPLRGTP